MKKHFESSTKYWTYDNNFVESDVKVRDHWHATEKYRGVAHRDCNTNFSQSCKISIAFQKLKIMIHILLWKNMGSPILK